MMLTLKQITKIYTSEEKENIVLRDINLEIKKGKFITIVGPSGSGKSTLLRIISGLLPQSEGEIIWGNLPKIGFVFQNYALFPYLTVYENTEFGLKMLGADKAKTKETVLELISEVGLSGYADEYPKKLSGGMKQRVGIARALAISPDVLLLDEPFSSLDEFTAEDLRKLLLGLWQKRQITIIMVTHLIQEAIELADEIVVISLGKIVQVVKNPLPRPRSLHSEKFFEMEDKVNKLMELNR